MYLIKQEIINKKFIEIFQKLSMLWKYVLSLFISVHETKPSSKKIPLF